MIITKKALSRRTVLRGFGATLALPLLDGMVPAMTAIAATPAKPTSRFGVVYLPNGIVSPARNWTPKIEGSGFEFTPVLKPLEAFRDRLLVLTGLDSGATGPGPNHSRASTRFLTGVSPTDESGWDLKAGISMDQMLGKELGQYTQLASLELGLDSMDNGGSCDQGYSCTYTNTLSWRGTATPLPVENNPRAVFERLFGDTQSTDTASRLARIESDRSILDSVTQKVTRLEKGLGPRDRAKLSEYLEAVRDVERRIQKAEKQSSQELPVVDQPPGIPGNFNEHANLMFDLQVLAYQCDLTRVITFMMGREFTGRTHPEIGIPDAHHPLSHHQNDAETMAKILKINVHHSVLFAGYLDKLRATPDGDGTLLDHMTILYGAGMAEGNGHVTVNLPVALAGGGAGRIRGGRNIRYPEGTPMSNLTLTLLEQFGVPMTTLGDSTGKLDLLTL